jgi:uncharacterized protein DUF3142
MINGPARRTARTALAIAFSAFNKSLKAATLLFGTLIAVAACSRSAPKISLPLPQRAYLWQRNWTPAVVDSLVEAQKRMNGVVVLGAEIVWNGKAPEIVSASIDWEKLKTQGKPFGVAIRVAPFAGPFGAGDAATRLLVDLAKSLLSEAAKHGAQLEEVQLDFDCAQKNLRNYRGWLRALRPVIHPARFVITTLPAWLDDPEFVPLVRETDGYVLQVHSVPSSHADRLSSLCDPVSARKWVAKAAELGLPFSVALPTYRCTAGYDPAGKLMGVAMDGVQPAWPPNTRILEFTTDADEVATLVQEWQRSRPPQLRELLWYRLPVATDTRNWRWATLSAVMSGRKPLHRLEVSQDGENPIDLSIVNAGEADEQLDVLVTATWKNNALISADALTGWTVDTTREDAVFATAPGYGARLAPGGKRKIGWLRYEQPTSIQLKLAKKDESPL